MFFIKILDYYILKQFWKNWLLASSFVTLVFLFQAFFADIYDHRYTVSEIFIYHFLNLPKIFIQMASPSVLLATVFTLSALSRSSELVACYAMGIGLRRILCIVLFSVSLISFGMLFLQDRLIPKASKIRINYRWQVLEKRKDFFLDFKRDKIWYRSKNMIYNLNRFDFIANTIYGIMVYSFDENFELRQLIQAQKAQYLDNHWKLFNGYVTSFLENDDFPVIENFKEKKVNIREKPIDFKEIEKEVDALPLKEHYQYIEKMKKAGVDTKASEVNFHSKISLCFIPFVMFFLAVPFSLSSMRAAGVGKDLALCITCTFFYWLFYSFGLSLGTNGVLVPWIAAWLPSFIFLALALGLLIRKY